jgi:hypothetical protein
MEINARIESLQALGKRLNFLRLMLDPANTDRNQDCDALMTQVRLKNPWFQLSAIHRALAAWANALNEENIKSWCQAYPDLNTEKAPRKIGVINAGNIPFVGLHDLLSVFLAGHDYIGKNAGEDPFLLPWLVNQWEEAFPGIKNRIAFVDKLSGMDAVIATGSNNSARYFDYYFGKYPHIIRKNRNGVAWLKGDETREQLTHLGHDIFSYYGLGCRNVAKLFIPSDYELKDFFEAMYDFNYVMEHHKYMNNFDYHHAIYLMKGIPFLQNNFLIVKEDESIASPLAVLHYERFATSADVISTLSDKKDEIQCVVTGSEFQKELRKASIPAVNFGQSQYPGLTDYADGVDTMAFLLEC